jgi:hypothetical protein
MRPLIPLAAAMVIGLGGSGAAWAQTVQPRDPNMPDPKTTVPEKVDPPMATTAGQTLSDRLEKSDGVIKPPSNVDPGITATPPVPNPGTMPVVPPPGSPGGNPNVQPK